MINKHIQHLYMVITTIILLLVSVLNVTLYSNHQFKMVLSNHKSSQWKYNLLILDIIKNKIGKLLN